MHEIVIISGKGGTGKTTLTASIIPFLDRPVLADCDVDAPDLHLLLSPEKKTTEPFFGTHKAELDKEKCTLCGLCAERCRFSAISSTIEINRLKCEGCGVCEWSCPKNAIVLKKASVGEIFSSTTEYGPMIHARLIPGEETSGKLAAEVRNRAKMIGEKEDRNIVIVDGSPGIGCSVISSVTGAGQAIIVTEATRSGLHDLERIYSLTQQLNVPAWVVINKWDLSPEISAEIEDFCSMECIIIALKIPFDRAIVDAVTRGKIPSVECSALFKALDFDAFIKKLTVY